jgi:glycosyltransferase involved in cell wall biosynthesis
MRLYYVDPGMLNNEGHHASWCRGIVGEVRARGIEVKIMTYAGIDAGLRAELGAIPFFRAFGYGWTDGDPVSGWLNWFESAATVTGADLARLTRIGADDLLFFMAGGPPQLQAVLRWLKRFAPGLSPHVAFDLFMEPGLDAVSEPGDIAYTVRDPREDARAILFRFAAREFADGDFARLHLVTAERATSKAYRLLLDQPVGVLPVAHPATAPLVNRAGRRPITASLLGHQRPEKGSHLIPAVARQLLSECDDIRVLVHGVGSAEFSQHQAVLRAMAATDTRLILEERVADEALWRQLLASTDLMLCPYDARRYALRNSGIVSEAIANGIPLVVPAGTALVRVMKEFGAGGVTFTRPIPQAIVGATKRALANFDALAGASWTAAQRWREVHGISRFVDALLALAKPA